MVCSLLLTLVCLCTSWDCLYSYQYQAAPSFESNCYGRGRGDGDDLDQLPAKADISSHRWLWNDAGAVSDDEVCNISGSDSTRQQLCATQDGSILIGGLISISDKDSSDRCQYLWDTPSIAVIFVEAFQQAANSTMHEITQQDPDFAKFVSGVEIHDSCHRGKPTLEASLAMVNQAAADVSGSGEVCKQSVPMVVGPSTSAETLVVTSILSAYQIPHISYWATSDRFFAKDDHPYLFRTVSSDLYQAEAMVDVMLAYGWTFVNVLGSADGYGRPGLRSFATAASKSGEICVYMTEEFDLFDKPRMELLLMKIILPFPPRAPPVGTPINKPNVIAVICGPWYAKALFETLQWLATHGSSDFKNELRKRHIVWLASDGWISSVLEIDLLSGGHNEAFGTHSVIGFEPQIPSRFANRSLAFREQLKGYLANSKTDRKTISRNPWLQYAVEHLKNCSFASNEMAGGTASRSLKLPCSEDWLAADILKYDLEHLPTPVATGSLWLAIRAALYAAWSVFKTNSRTGEAYRKALLRPIDCDEGPASCEIFESKQDVAPGYIISSLEYSKTSGNGARAVAEWVQSRQRNGISKFRCLNTSSANLSSCLPFANQGNSPPPSTCAQPCKPGEERNNIQLWSVDGVRAYCCWHCVKCDEYSISDGNDTSCKRCTDELLQPDRSRSMCVDKEAHVYFAYSTTQTLTLLVVSTLVMVTLLCTACTYFQKKVAPEAECMGWGQTKALLLMLMFGVACSFSLFISPSCLVCTLKSTLILIAAVSPVAIQISRSLRLVALSSEKQTISDWTRKLGRVFGSSASRQLGCSAVIIGLCLTFHLIWSGIHRPCGEKMADTTVEKHLATVYLVCKDVLGVSFIPVFFFNSLALIVAFAARKAFTSAYCGQVAESQLVFISLLAQILLFTLLTPAFLLANPSVHPALEWGSLILQDLVIWMTVFLPRLYRSGAMKPANTRGWSFRQSIRDPFLRHSSRVSSSRLTISSNLPPLQVPDEKQGKEQVQYHSPPDPAWKKQHSFIRTDSVFPSWRESSL